MLKTMVLFAHSPSCSGFVNRFKNNNDDNKEDIPWFSLVIPGPRDLKSDFSCVIFSRLSVITATKAPICWALPLRSSLFRWMWCSQQGCGHEGASGGGSTWLPPFKPVGVIVLHSPH